ncbi:MAG: hypothetical protein HQK51_04310 [Oligoflexia bacterium]|nr:hypothetical protein [Oligoflexia bacterium]
MFQYKNFLISIFFRLILVNCILFILANFSYANILIEPSLGYALKGVVKQKLEAGGTTYENESTGLGYGLRLGYIRFGFMLGIQGDMISEDWTGKGPKVTDVNDKKQKMDGRNAGIFVGYQTPFFVKLWTTFYCYDEYVKKDDNGPYSKDDAYLGTGYTVGLGVAFLYYMAMNIEYRKFSFDKLRVKADEKTYKLDNERDVNKSEIYLSLSFPFNF